MLTPGEMNKIFIKINPILESLNERIEQLEASLKEASNAKPETRKATTQKEVDK